MKQSMYMCHFWFWYFSLFLASREASPQRIHSSISTSTSNSPQLPEDSDHSDEEYIDTIDVSRLTVIMCVIRMSRLCIVRSNRICL